MKFFVFFYCHVREIEIAYLSGYFRLTQGLMDFLTSRFDIICENGFEHIKEVLVAFRD
jgi:hypothetical protein